MGKDELIVIVPAAGAGKRLGLGINKAFAMLNGAPLLVHCLHMLEATGLVKRVVVVLAPQEVVEGRELLAGYQKDYFRRLPFCVVAGNTVLTLLAAGYYAKRQPPEIIFLIAWARSVRTVLPMRWPQ